MNNQHIQDPWWELRFSAANPEEAAALLVDAGAGGAQIIDEHHIRVYLQASAEGLREFLSAAEDYGVSLIETAPVVHKNWTAQCPELWEPIAIGSLKVVPVDDTAPFADRKKPASGELFIVPGTGFGTGHHASTSMLLELLQSEPMRELRPKRVLDVGTGSGILAIAAHALYGAEVLANDIDPLALENARQNIALNGCSAAIELTAQEASALQGSFALIVANIYAEVLCSLRPQFERLLAPSGVLLLSGIMLPRATGLLQEFEARGWKVQSRLEREGWIGLALIR